MAKRKQPTSVSSQRAGAFTSECINLLDQGFDALIKRSELEEPFSADLTGSVQLVDAITGTPEEPGTRPRGRY
jgi:hypothetical protein